MTVNKIVVAVFVVVICSVFIGMITRSAGSQPATTKNRVPTMTQYADQAQQAAKDAQTAAAEATKAQKDIAAAVEKVNGTQRNASGELKEGRPEITQPGIISDFGSFKIEAATGTAGSEDYYLGFTHTDRNGFTKRFFPVCPNQTVRVGGLPLTIMYHWRAFQSTNFGERGCYLIDGFQQ